MKVRIKKWGKGGFVRIPTSIMTAAALSVDQTVEVTVAGGRVILEPIGTIYCVEQLVERMQPNTFPADADFGPHVGQEAW